MSMLKTMTAEVLPAAQNQLAQAFKAIRKAMVAGEHEVIFNRTNDLASNDAMTIHPIVANQLQREHFTVVAQSDKTYTVSGWDNIH